MNMDKEIGYHNVETVDEKPSDYSVTVNALPSHKGNPWRPGFFARFPWKAFSSIFGALLCLIGAIILICMVQDKDQWPNTISPNIIASLFATGIGGMTRYALGEGITVSWWKSAVRGARVEELHNRWEYGHSTLSSVLSGRSVNSAAIASILALLVSANGALFQKTIQVVKHPVARPKAVVVPISSNLNLGQFADGVHPFSSCFVGKPNASDSNAMQLLSYTNYFRQIERKAVFFENVTIWGWEGSKCNGTCDVMIPGFGFKPLACQESSTPFQISLNNTSDSVDIFSVNVSYGDYDYHRSDGASGYASNAINVSMTFRDYRNNANLSNSADCRGLLTTRKCQFMANKVNYSASIQPSIGLTTFVLNLNNFTSQDGDRFRDPDQYGERIDIQDRLQSGSSALAGFALSLRNRFGARASLSVNTDDGAPTWKVTRVGATASGHVKNGYNSTGYEVGGCLATSSDPFDDIQVALRDLAFRTSMGIPFVSERIGQERPDIHQFLIDLDSTEKKVILRYSINRDYLWPAVAGTLVSLTAIFFLFPGWDEIGRYTTMSPIETARAFDAPYLQSKDPNAEVVELVKEIGDRKVQYGNMTQAAGTTGAKLGIAHADLVERPLAGERFSGS